MSKRKCGCNSVGLIVVAGGFGMVPCPKRRVRKPAKRKGAKK